MIFGFSRKNPSRGGFEHKDTLLKSPLEILDMSLYPKKFRREKAFTPGNSANLCDNPWKFQSNPYKKISEILPLHSGIIVVLSNK